MLDEFFYDYSGTIMGDDEFNYVERREKINMMVDLITAQVNNDDEILNFLCNLINDKKYIDFLCKKYHITIKNDFYYVDEQYLKDEVYND